MVSLRQRQALIRQQQQHIRPGRAEALCWHKCNTGVKGGVAAPQNRFLAIIIINNSLSLYFFLIKNVRAICSSAGLPRLPTSGNNNFPSLVSFPKL